MDKEEYLFTGSFFVIMLLLIIAIYLVSLVDGDPRWECDKENHIGWEREYQYWYTTWQTVGKTQVPVQHYHWVRIRELGEKEYNIYCLGVEG